MATPTPGLLNYMVEVTCYLQQTTLCATVPRPRFAVSENSGATYWRYWTRGSPRPARNNAGTSVAGRRVVRS